MNNHSDELRIPAERDLPDPDAMFASIIGATAAGDPDADDPGLDELAQRRTRRRGTYLAPIAVAAALALVVGGFGLMQRFGPSADPAAPGPTPSHTPQPLPTGSGPSLPVTSPSSSQTSTSQTPSQPASSVADPSSNSPDSSSNSTTQPSSTPRSYTFGARGKADFRYVTVELTGHHEGPDSDGKGRYQHVNLTICVTALPAEDQASGKLPIGAAAFSMSVGEGAPLQRVVVPQPKYYPAPGSSLALNSCADGYLSFDFAAFPTSGYGPVVLGYRNSWGETALWTLN